MSSHVAGRPFEDLAVDVGFGPPPSGTPDTIAGPDLLGFAGIPSVPVPVIDLSAHVAEKVHACIRTYADGVPSSRFKDLVDIILMQRAFPFSAGDLRRAMDATFRARDGMPASGEPPAPPRAWARGYQRLAAEVGIETDLDHAFRVAVRFVNPVLSGAIADTCVWDPARQAWRASDLCRGNAWLAPHLR